MRVQLSHPEREVEIKGPKRVKELLRDLDLVQEAHLVIRGDDLMTEDEMLKDTDQVEIRPVISGGCSKRSSSKAADEALAGGVASGLR
jgi:sulfur carrier protein